MITVRELALHEDRMALVARREAEAAQPRALLQVAAKSLGSVPFNRVDLGGAVAGEKLVSPYRQSIWVQRAIRLKAGEITAVPVKFYAGDVEYADPQFAAFWARPYRAPGGKRFTFAQGQERLHGWLNLRGLAYVVGGDEWLQPFPEVARLQPLLIASPDRMRPVCLGSELVGWEFVAPDGRRWPLLPGQVEQIATWNPEDEHGGLSPLEALANAAESDYLAGVYVRNLMRNNGDQGVYVIAKGGMPREGQQEQIIAQLREKRRAAARGDFRPVFLTGEIEIEDAKAQAPDAALNATRLLDRHTVFIGYGVPASMADVQASYSIGSDSDRARLITGTCMAEARVINEPAGVFASRMAGRPITAESDWDEHPVMQQIRQARLQSAQGLWDRGMAWREINDYLDLGLKPFPGWEIAYLPFSATPVGALEAQPDRKSTRLNSSH